MASMFSYYLLGVWLTLGQFPKETIANSLKHSSKGICNSIFDFFEEICKTKMQRGLNVQEEVALQEGPLSEVPIIVRYRDIEDLKALSESNPEFPQELKAALSDSWSLLRKLRQQKKEGEFLKILTQMCCLMECIKEIRSDFCD
uniref:prorelaxin-like n=1 Tax=Ictidomys tridecemlineatus TaxID=43179 RepID=UPI001A9D480D|nr:prorelaxin-like [Ictidomys tridecemlineatus]